MQIYTSSVFVEDQAKGLDFYKNVLGFRPKHDEKIGDDRWLTLVSPEDPDGTELLLEPSRHPAKKAFKEALVKEGIPAAMFRVSDLDAEHDRLTAMGVEFKTPPTDAGKYRIAIIDDTCGNFIQLIEMRE